MNSELDFNEYKLKYLASGGYAKLYIAVPKQSDKPSLCLKFLNQELLQSPTHLNRFQEELSLLKNLHHNRVPKLIYGVSNVPKPYLAYNHIEGKTILSLLQESVGSNSFPFKIINKPVNWLFKNLNIYYNAPDTKISSRITTRLAINIMIQLLEILDYLHSLPEPIVHSDISPDNLLLDSQNNLYLIDFGCARTLKSDNNFMQKWIGKPSYLSPEQAQGLDWDQRSDLYQAGIVFYELLCNHKKNFGINEREARIVAANPPMLNLFYIPSFLNEFITKLLHNDIKQRWQFAGECITELKYLQAKISEDEDNQV